jgi:hypothetical protein
MNDESMRQQLNPGTVVEVTQQIPHRDRTWTNTVRGTIVSYQQKQTGSWFAHSKNDKLWLDRLMLRKEDGEFTTLNLDDYSHVKVLGTSADVDGKPGTATGEMTTK